MHVKFRGWAVSELQLVLFEKSLQYGISDGILCGGTLLPGGMGGPLPPPLRPHFLYAALRMHTLIGGY